MTRRHTYHLEHDIPRQGWTRLPGSEVGREFGLGYIHGRCHAPGPRLATRLVRDDGRVIDTAPSLPEASIGPVAGWPTPAQYRAAADRCLRIAEDLERRIADRERDP